MTALGYPFYAPNPEDDLLELPEDFRSRYSPSFSISTGNSSSPSSFELSIDLNATTPSSAIRLSPRECAVGYSGISAVMPGSRLVDIAFYMVMKNRAQLPRIRPGWCSKSLSSSRMYFESTLRVFLIHQDFWC